MNGKTNAKSAAKKSNSAECQDDSVLGKRAGFACGWLRTLRSLITLASLAQDQSPLETRRPAGAIRFSIAAVTTQEKTSHPQSLTKTLCEKNYKMLIRSQSSLNKAQA
jgi:hypothetical protein